MWSQSEPEPRRRASDAPLQLKPVVARDPGIELALADNRVEAWYQPQFDLESGRLVGAEALARIAGVDDAGHLFARASAAGLAERLSRQVQRNVLHAAARWRGPLEGLPIAINLLPEDIARERFDDWLLAEIAGAGMAFGRVTAEITEEALIADVGGVTARLARLRSAGVAIALDDFGSGYANLANVTRLPLDCLKLDRSLVARIEQGEADRIVVRAALRLAGELGLRVIVEGVETAGQLALLREWGCDVYQGFLGAKPMSAERLAAFAAGRR